jgi:hypothetical protein
MSFTFIRLEFHTKEPFRRLLHAVYILNPTESGMEMTLIGSGIFEVYSI